MRMQIDRAAWLKEIAISIGLAKSGGGTDTLLREKSWKLYEKEARAALTVIEPILTAAEGMRKTLEAVKNDINNCDWTCERCGQDYGMPETDIAHAVNLQIAAFDKAATQPGADNGGSDDT